MITVSDLIEDLKTCDPEAIVILAADPEGNKYYGRFDVSDNWIGIEHGEPVVVHEDDLSGSEERGVVLWP